MKKTLLTLQLCIVVAITLTSCNQPTDTSTITNNDTQIQQFQDSIKSLQAKIDTASNTTAQAVIVPVSNNIIKGGKYEAQIYLVGVNSITEPKITVNDKTLEGNTYTINCNTVGSFDINGKIEFTKPDGTIDECPFSTQYAVAEPTAIISSNQMHILYYGIPNKISVNVPGVSSENIKVEATNVKRISKEEDNNWLIFSEYENTEGFITVSVKNADGSFQKIEQKKYRVFELPDPQAYIEYYDNDGHIKRCNGRSITKAELMRANSINVSLDAPFDVYYRVHLFEISIQTSEDSLSTSVINSSNRFSEEIFQLLRKVKPGDYIFIYNIRASGPDGIARHLAPIEVRVKAENEDEF